MSFNEILGSSIALTIVVVITVLTFVCNWKIFVKMGEPGWKCLIPFYNLYVQSKHCWTMAGFVILLILDLIPIILALFTMTTTLAVIVLVVAIASLVLRIGFYYYTCRAFGKGVGMTILYILFPFITELILGFGASEYEGNKAIK